MKFRFTIPVLVASLAFSGTAAFQINADAQTSSSTVKKASTPPTTFKCIGQTTYALREIREGTQIKIKNQLR
jgi:hypothetical protein